MIFMITNRFDHFCTFSSASCFCYFSKRRAKKERDSFSKFSLLLLKLLPNYRLRLMKSIENSSHSSWIHFAESYGNRDALDFFQCHDCFQFGHPLIGEASVPHDRKVFCVTVAQVVPMTVTY